MELFRRFLFSGIATTCIGFPCTSLAGTYSAVCSYYSRYEPCTVSITNSSIQANLPSDYLDLDPSSTKEVFIYKDIGKESNVLVGTASTIILGPIGLLGFLVQKKIASVDFGFNFIQSGRKRTAFIRFVNLSTADRFAGELKPFLLQVDSHRKQPI